MLCINRPFVSFWKCGIIQNHGIWQQMQQDSHETPASCHFYLSKYPKNVPCEHCQVMDREEGRVCCHEIEQVANKNEEVMEYTKPTLPYNCITDNPGFHTVCLDRWVLQAVLLQYKQQYGSTAYEGPDHKISCHVAYRQLVRWCRGVVGKEIQVVLPSCAVSTFGPTFHHQAMKMTLNLLDFVLLLNNLIVALSGMSTYNQFIYSNYLSILFVSQPFLDNVLLWGLRCRCDALGMLGMTLTHQCGEIQLALICCLQCMQRSSTFSS